MRAGSPLAFASSVNFVNDAVNALFNGDLKTNVMTASENSDERISCGNKMVRTVNLIVV